MKTKNEMVELLIQNGARLERAVDPEEFQGAKQVVVRLVARSQEDKLFRPMTPDFPDVAALETFLEKKLAA